MLLIVDAFLDLGFYPPPRCCNSGRGIICRILATPGTARFLLSAGVPTFSLPAAFASLGRAPFCCSQANKNLALRIITGLASAAHSIRSWPTSYISLLWSRMCSRPPVCPGHTVAASASRSSLPPSSLCLRTAKCRKAALRLVPRRLVSPTDRRRQGGDARSVRHDEPCRGPSGFQGPLHVARGALGPPACPMGGGGRMGKARPLTSSSTLQGPSPDGSRAAIRLS